MRCEQLDVTVLFIKGTASSCLVERCRRDNVAVVTGVPYRALQAIAESSQAALCVYVAECCQVCVFFSNQFSTDYLRFSLLFSNILVSFLTAVCSSPCFKRF
jgi:hypothetical protein